MVDCFFISYLCSHKSATKGNNKTAFLFIDSDSVLTKLLFWYLKNGIDCSGAGAVIKGQLKIFTKPINDAPP